MLFQIRQPKINAEVDLTTQILVVEVNHNLQGLTLYFTIQS